MSFAAPSQLWWLAPLGGLIVALYLLRMRRRDVQVPATFLWPEHTEEVRANALIQRLRFNLLMVLQLLALLLLILALARPQSMRRGLTSQVTVFVIDTGASMAATDVPGSRLGLARQTVGSAIDAARPTDRMAIIAAGPTPQVLCALSGDKAKLRSALQLAGQVDAAPAMDEALRLAAALCADESGARIVVLSDGTFPPVKDFSPGRAAVAYERIGTSDRNAAITALGVSDSVKGRLIYCGLHNDSATPIEGSLTILGDGKLVDSRRVTLAPGADSGFSLPVSTSIRVFEANLDVPDFLKSDNYAVAVSEENSRLRVLMVAKGGDPFLEKALVLDPRVSLDKSESLPSKTGDYDIVVFDGVPEAPVQARGVLAFGSPGPASPAVGSAVAERPTASVAEDVPVMTGVDLSSTFIRTAALTKPTGSGRVVAEGRTRSGESVPLIVQAEGARPHLYVAFRPGDSDFPLQPAFPIFVANALDFLSGPIAGGDLSIATGAPVSIPANGPATLTDPTGATRRLYPTGGSLILRSLDHIGRYRLQVDGKDLHLYATLKETSSQIGPSDRVSVGSRSVGSSLPLRQLDIWRYAVVAGLLVLVGEWWLFARRS